MASEQAFSVAGNTITPTRNKLDPETTRATLCLKSWIENEMGISNVNHETSDDNDDNNSDGDDDIYSDSNNNSFSDSNSSSDTENSSDTDNE